MREFSHEYAEHWFHTPTPIEKEGGLWPIRAGQNKAKSNYKMGPRIITYYSIHFILKGKGTFSQNEINEDIQEGDIFCLLPNQTHQYSSDPDHPLQMFWLAFNGRQAKLLLKRIGITNYSTHVKGILNDEITDILNELVTHFKQGDEKDDDLMGLSIVYNLFHTLSIQSKLKNLAPSTPRNWIQKSQEYMNMHFAENISVKDVAKYVGIHRSYFTDSFVNELGITPSNYLLSLKMNRAVELLLEKTHTITEIALTLGYSDLYSFSRAFKNHYGIAPNQYLAKE